MRFRLIYMFVVCVVLSACGDNIEQRENALIDEFGDLMTEAPSTLKGIPAFNVIDFVLKDTISTIEMQSALKPHHLIVYFDPQCEDCNFLGRQLGKFLEEAGENMSVWFLSLENDPEGIKNYALRHRLDEADNVFFFLGLEEEIAAYFGAVTLTPTAFYFNNAAFNEKFEVFIPSEKLKGMK